MSDVVNDGFGNELTTDEMVANYWKWAHKVGTQYRSNPNYDDIVQEGLIAVWKVAQKHPEGVPANYVTTTAQYRMREVATEKRPMTGGDSTPGPKSRPDLTLVDWQAATAPSEDESDRWELLLHAVDVLDAVDWAYHAGEIRQVLEALPERDRVYVQQRFWGGLTDTEIAAAQGVDKRMLGNRWKRTVKPRLQQALASLASLQ